MPPSLAYTGSDWFDPLEEAVRLQVRSFIEELLEEELEAVLGREGLGLVQRLARDGGDMGPGAVRDVVDDEVVNGIRRRPVERGPSGVEVRPGIVEGQGADLLLRQEEHGPPPGKAEREARKEDGQAKVEELKSKLHRAAA